MYNDLHITPVSALAKFKSQISGELFDTYDEAARYSNQLMYDLNTVDGVHQLKLMPLTAWRELFKLRHPEAQPE